MAHLQNIFLFHMIVAFLNEKKKLLCFYCLSNEKMHILMQSYWPILNFKKKYIYSFKFSWCIQYHSSQKYSIKNYYPQPLFKIFKKNSYHVKDILSKIYYEVSMFVTFFNKEMPTLSLELTNILKPNKRN